MKGIKSTLNFKRLISNKYLIFFEWCQIAVSTHIHFAFIQNPTEQQSHDPHPYAFYKPENDPYKSLDRQVRQDLFTAILHLMVKLL